MASSQETTSRRDSIKPYSSDEAPQLSSPAPSQPRPKMKTTEIQTDGPKIDWNTYEHKAPKLPEDCKPDFEKLQMAKNQGKPPKKPLPPIPPRMKDWSKT